MRMQWLLLAVILPIVLVGCSGESPTGSVPDTALPSATLVENGVSLAAGGVGLTVQPAEFSVDVPVADAGEIVEAWFYWSGRGDANVGDDTIEINGVEYVGTLLANYPVNGGSRFTFFYKMDAMDLVQPGLNEYTVDGFDLDTPELINGIGLAVVYEDADSECIEVQMLEPGEFIYWNDPDYPQGEVHNFAFEPLDEERSGTLLLFVGDAAADRPDRIWWHSGAGDSHPGELIGGPYDFFENELDASEGPQFDVFWAVDLPIPAGAGHLAYQLESPDPGNGDSMMHSFAAFCVTAPPPPPPPQDACFWTIGFWKHEFNVATGDKNGRQHLTDEELTELLADVEAITDIDYDGGDGVISFRDADDYLDLHGQQTMCARARQQFLATLLNYAWNGMDDTILVDTDYDDVPDTEFGEAIETIEDLILGAGGEEDDDCEDAKDMADSINNMPDCSPWDEDNEQAQRVGPDVVR